MAYIPPQGPIITTNNKIITLNSNIAPTVTKINLFKFSGPIKIINFSAFNNGITSPLDAGGSAVVLGTWVRDDAGNDIQFGTDSGSLNFSSGSIKENHLLRQNAITSGLLLIQPSTTRKVNVSLAASANSSPNFIFAKSSLDVENSFIYLKSTCQTAVDGSNYIANYTFAIEWESIGGSTLVEV